MADKLRKGVLSTSKQIASNSAWSLHMANVHLQIAEVRDKPQLQRANGTLRQCSLLRIGQRSSGALPTMSVRITCPDEVADVIANDDRAVAGVARAEALAAIIPPCRADGIDCHTKHGRPALPVSIGLALLEEVWPQSAGCHPEPPQSMHTATLVTEL